MRLRPCAAWLALLLTTACAPEVAEDPVATGPSCGVNTTEEDGVCVSVFDGDWDWDSVFQARATTCEAGDGRIDPVTGCIGEVCLGDSIATIRSRWGLGDCVSRQYGPFLIPFCAVQGQDVEVVLPLDGSEGPPEAVATGPAFEGATPDGVGPGIATTCAWGALGPPDDLWLYQDVAREEMTLGRAYWRSGAVSVASDGSGDVVSVMLGGWL